jgi:hypothetical protein
MAEAIYWCVPVVAAKVTHSKVCASLLHSRRSEIEEAAAFSIKSDEFPGNPNGNVV